MYIVKHIVGQESVNHCVVVKRIKVRLDHLQQLPSEMIALFDVNRSASMFLEHIRAYNNVLALASLGCNQVCMTGFNSNFKIQGKMFHRIGSQNQESAQWNNHVSCMHTTVYNFNLQPQ